MSWRGSSSQSPPANTSLSLLSGRPPQRSLPREAGQTMNAPAWGENWSGNTTWPRSDPPMLGYPEACHVFPALMVCLVACYCVTMALGLVANASLMGIIARRKERANVTSIFICNLSLADILVCAFCLPFTVTYKLMDHWVFGLVLCRAVPFIQCVSVTVSILSMVFIALERHQLIINPSGWKPSVPQAYAAIVVIWLLSGLTSLPFLVVQLLTDDPYSDLPQAMLMFPIHPQIPPHSNEPLTRPLPYSAPSPLPDLHASASPRGVPASPHLEACLEHWPSRRQRLAYTTWLLLFQYCGPLLLVLLCYIRVFVRLRRRQDMLDHARTLEFHRVTRRRRVNLMLLTLVATFALCWFPLTVFNAVSDWKHEALPICHHDLLFFLCHLLAMSSTCINPVIYGYLNSTFRQEVREALLQLCCRHPPEEASPRVPTVHMEVSRTTAPLSRP